MDPNGHDGNIHRIRVFWKTRCVQRVIIVRFYTRVSETFNLMVDVNCKVIYRCMEFSTARAQVRAHIFPRSLKVPWDLDLLWNVPVALATSN